MSKKIFLPVIMVTILALATSGCSTARKKTNDEITGIKTRVETLETRVETVEAKQVEVEKAVQTTATTAVSEPAWPETNFDVKSSTTPVTSDVKQIQKALKNAGYYSGSVDGVKGKNTKRAIKAFQRDHGLTADGVVGSKTWDALSKYAAGGEGGTK
jgi:murein L,D-transpeptidase YcbB/YkuD